MVSKVIECKAIQEEDSLGFEAVLSPSALKACLALQMKPVDCAVCRGVGIRLVKPWAVIVPNVSLFGESVERRATDDQVTY